MGRGEKSCRQQQELRSSEGLLGVMVKGGDTEEAGLLALRDDRTETGNGSWGGAKHTAFQSWLSNLVVA